MTNIWNSLMHFNLVPGELVIRATVVYLFVLILLRLGGKRQVGQMGPSEFVAVLLISNAVQNSMNGGDNSLVGGMVLAAVLVALSTLISYLTYRSKRISNLFEGVPRILIHDGKILEKNLHREFLSRSELSVLLRAQGVHDLKEVKTAILEPTGVLSIFKSSGPFLMGPPPGNLDVT